MFALVKCLQAARIHGDFMVLMHLTVSSPMVMVLMVVTVLTVCSPMVMVRMAGM